MTKDELYDLLNTAMAENAKLEERLRQWMVVAERRGLAVNRTRERVGKISDTLNNVVVALLTLNDNLERVMVQEQNTGS